MGVVLIIAIREISNHENEFDFNSRNIRPSKITRYTVVASCVVFHNMCEFYGDMWPIELADTDTQITPHPCTTTVTDSARMQQCNIYSHIKYCN